MIDRGHSTDLRILEDVRNSGYKVTSNGFVTLGLILDEVQLHKRYIKKLNKRFGIKEMQRKQLRFGIPIIERKRD